MKKGFLPPCIGKRCVVLVVGLFVMSLGVAFSITGNLGTSPISSLPYTISAISNLTVGNATILMHCVLVLLQILILRKRYQPFQLLQLVVAVVFGYLTDFSLWLLSALNYNNYAQQWILCVIGILLVALGVALEVTAGVVVLAGEGLVLAVCEVAPIKFGNMKVVFDVTLVVLACIVGLVFTRQLQGVREGTVAAAICVGLVSKQYLKPLKKFEERFLTQKEAA